MKGILPESVRTRTQKLGFITPPDAWSSPWGREFIQAQVASAEFQQSSIWDGRKIATDLTKAINSQNSRNVHQAWIYVQAMSLMRLFREKWKTYRIADPDLEISL